MSSSEKVLMTLLQDLKMTWGSLETAFITKINRTQNEKALLLASISFADRLLWIRVMCGQRQIFNIALMWDPPLYAVNKIG